MIKNGSEILLDLMFDSGERKCEVNMGSSKYGPACENKSDVNKKWNCVYELLCV